MNVLVYGSKGWIGQMFTQLLDKYEIFYNDGTSRVDNIDDIKNELEYFQPTHVVSFIGRTHGPGFSTIDYLEQEGKLYENVRDNLFSPFVLAQLCKEYNIHYTYLGTGCIFKYNDNQNDYQNDFHPFGKEENDFHPFGKEENGFTEESKPNFFGSSYSVVKGFTDMMMHLYPNVLNLRIRMPITGEKNSRNFITKITNYKKICSVPNSMTVLPELLPYVIDMMLNKVTGTINLTNPGLISHNEILEMYKEIVDPDFTWENFTQEEQRLILKADRSNNYMDTTKLTDMYPNIKNIKESVRKYLYLYKQS